MTDKYIITQDDLIPVTVEEAPAIPVVAGTAEPVAIVLIEGPRGPAGPEAVFVSTVLNGANGSQTVFTLPQTARYPSQIQVYRNGLREVVGVGFTATTTALTFTTAPLATDVVAVFYERF